MMSSETWKMFTRGKNKGRMLTIRRGKRKKSSRKGAALIKNHPSGKMIE